MTDEHYYSLTDLRELLGDPGDIEVKKRPRGILTHTDREYLFGLRGYEHPQSEANRRQEIRERIQNALQDFPILFALLDGEERFQVFAELDDDTLRESLAAMFAFSYLGLDREDERLENVLERGLYLAAHFARAEKWVGAPMDVDVSVHIDYGPDVEMLEERLEGDEDRQLTPAEIGVLARAGKLDADDLDRLEASAGKSGQVPTPVAAWVENQLENDGSERPTPGSENGEAGDGGDP